MNRRNIILLLIRLAVGISLVVGVWWLVKCHCLSLSDLTPASIRDYIQSFGKLAAVVYIAAYVLNTVSVIPPIAPLSLTAGLAFGAGWGAVYLMIAALIGTSATFALSRFFARGIVEKALRDKFKSLDDKLAENGFMTVLFFRVIPLIPYEVLNYAGGLSKMRFKDYFLATFLGLIPGVVIASFFGGRLGEIKGPADLLAPRFLVSAGLMLLVILIPLIYRMIKKRKETFQR